MISPIRSSFAVAWNPFSRIAWGTSTETSVIIPIKIEFPKGNIALNAVPWAEVWVDGEKVGETPIGNLSLSLGPHEVVFRHPELGEKRVVTTVTLAGPAKVSVDMRKK